MDIRRALNKARKAGSVVRLDRGGRGLSNFWGIPLAVGKSLVLLRNIPDFQIEGHAVLAIASIVSVRSNAFERFFERVIRDRYGSERLQRPGPEVDLTDWPCFFSGFVGKKPFVIVEAEREPHSDFLVGRILESTDRAVTMRAIDPTAKWYEGTHSLPHRRVTCAKLDDSYSRVFEKYERLARKQART